MATTAPISLKNLLVASKDVQVDFPGFDGFKINLAFLSKDTLVGIRKKSTKQSLKNRQVSEEIDDELFLKLYVEAAIKGWSGLKIKYLEQLAPIDTTGLDPESELPFSSENALFLMKNANTFDLWVSETVSDLSNFQTSKGSK